MTLTTLDDDLCRIIEPNVSVTSERLQALQCLRDAGIPTIVWLTPLLPFINDMEENVAGLVHACAQAGVRGIIVFGMGLTLREGSREYFYAALDRRFPGLKQRYIQTYGNAYELPSPNVRQLMHCFHTLCDQYGIMHDDRECFDYLHAFPKQYEQLDLFNSTME